MGEQWDIDALLEPLRTDLTTATTDLSSLRADVSAARADITALHVALTTLRGKHDQMVQALSAVGDAVHTVQNAVTASQDVLNDFVERYGRDQVVVNAHAELTRLTVEWKADFAQRERVRGLARGLTRTMTFQAVDSGLVDKDTIEACVREQFLVEPTFWLAPAIMALAARHTGDTVRASRATAHAFFLDSAKSQLFFALTCSSLGRQSEAAAWMDRYLNSLNRDELGPEFGVVLEAVANAELGHEAYTYAREAMARWFREDRTAFQAVPGPATSPHLAPWAGRLMEFGEDPSPGRFAALRELTGLEWPALENGWRTATALDGTLDYLRSFPKVVDLPAGKGRYTDSALDHLIDQLEPDEAEHRERMIRLRALIKHDGDAEAAAAAVDEGGQDKERLDFVTLLARAVFEPEFLGLGTAARKLALISVWESVRASAASMARTSRALIPPEITLSVEGWSCAYPTDSSSSFDAIAAADHLVRHVERRTRRQIESIGPAWTMTATAAALAAVCMGAHTWYAVTGPFSVVLVVLTVVCSLAALGGVAHAPLRRRSLREAGERQRANAAYALTRAVGELENLLDDWRHGLRSADLLDEWHPGREREVEA
ncbi:hypothetical protein [Streptomyces lomondensis]|uniref:Uncharacterized protein n=1 Tax=Streptomyces lomondensis TaxID=68229 RepID=A0ABQ2WY28_9ACTN|nr:hypothetical protein [Streptomyces lomondensis]MCF0078647.1 hypothetical protein [Streptomyces lomondensis]GGW79042.1 hypothetical protein GCM10010383_03140 [Streptomyces lomondensis]